jgi:hypothetical protein
MWWLCVFWTTEYGYQAERCHDLRPAVVSEYEDPYPEEYPREEEELGPVPEEDIFTSDSCLFK